MHIERIEPEPRELTLADTRQYDWVLLDSGDWHIVSIARSSQYAYLRRGDRIHECGDRYPVSTPVSRLLRQQIVDGQPQLVEVPTGPQCKQVPLSELPVGATFEYDGDVYYLWQRFEPGGGCVGRAFGGHTASWEAGTLVTPIRRVLYEPELEDAE